MMRKGFAPLEISYIKNVLSSKTRFLTGFTLIELLIVIGIIGALIAIAVPTYRGWIPKAKTRADMANMKMINTALEVYKIRQGIYPSADDAEGEATANQTNLQTFLYDSVNYFPDGPPGDPFTGLTGISAYTVEVKGTAPYIHRVYEGTHKAHLNWTE